MLLMIAGLSVAMPLVAGQQPDSSKPEESLGDVARQVRDQRAKTPQKPAKVITNDDLPAPPPGAEGPSVATKNSENPAGGEEPNPADTAAKPASPESTQEKPGAQPESPEGKIKNQEYWQGKFKEARKNVAHAKEEQQLAEDELNLLQIQQARELGPDAKDELSTQVRNKQAEVEAKQAATDKAQKALDDLQQEFSESGAPEEWSKTD
jgi:hypothetical protein